jgi:hypothetical protein
MKGTGIPNDSIGNYGIVGVPAVTNQPPCRSWGAQSWVDLNGNLWMFGGEDNNTVAPYGFSDLWKYDIAANMWTWMKGPDIPGQPGIYGIKGVPNILNNPPPSIENAASWTSNSGDLYLLEHTSNALWKYNIASNMWTWIKGAPASPVVYGIKGVEDSLNNPGGSAYSRWKDNNGFFWKFDGGGLLWRYNPATNNWTWMSGNLSYVSVSNYGTKCISSPQNLPCGRNEGRAAWEDADGNFWLFGGYSFYSAGGLSDMWMYNVSSNQWTWAAGDSTLNASANYGTLGVSSPSNNPGYKEGAVGWTGNNGHLYLFGGFGYNSSTNALWRFTIDTLCAPLGNEEISGTDQELQVYPNPATGELTIIITRNNIKKAGFILFNVLGETVFSETENFIKDSFTKKINISHLAPGIYILQINMDGYIVTKKIEKK